MFTELSRRLVLNYDPGQFTFRNFIQTSTDEQLLDLAEAVNLFQDTPVAKVLKIQTFDFM